MRKYRCNKTYNKIPLKNIYKMLRGKISKIVEYSSKKKKKKNRKNMFDLIFSHLLLVFKIKYLNFFF